MGYSPTSKAAAGLLPAGVVRRTARPGTHGGARGRRDGHPDDHPATFLTLRGARPLKQAARDNNTSDRAPHSDTAGDRS